MKAVQISSSILSKSVLFATVIITCFSTISCYIDGYPICGPDHPNREECNEDYQERYNNPTPPSYSVPEKEDVSSEQWKIRSKIYFDMGVTIGDGECPLRTQDLKNLQKILNAYHSINMIKGKLKTIIVNPSLEQYRPQAYAEHKTILYFSDCDNSIGKMKWDSIIDIQGYFAHELGHIFAGISEKAKFVEEEMVELYLDSSVSREEGTPYSQDFISSYAETNSFEDFAETFDFISYQRDFDIFYRALNEIFNGSEILQEKIFQILEIIATKDKAHTLIWVDEKGERIQSHLIREYDPKQLSLVPIEIKIQRNTYGRIRSFTMPPQYAREDLKEEYHFKRPIGI